MYSVYLFFFSFTFNTQTEVNLAEVHAGMTSVAATTEWLR